MLVSQKCQYALRAVFELARQNGHGPIPIARIAQTQAIPARFLEVILGELKQGGFVESRRGARGGYVLARPASELSVGEVMRFVQGPIGPVDCVEAPSQERCPLYGGCVFLAMWERARSAMAEVYDSTTFAELVDEDARTGREHVPRYSI